MTGVPNQSASKSPLGNSCNKGEIYIQQLTGPDPPMDISCRPGMSCSWLVIPEAFHVFLGGFTPPAPIVGDGFLPLKRIETSGVLRHWYS